MQNQHKSRQQQQLRQARIFLLLFCLFVCCFLLFHLTLLNTGSDLTILRENEATRVDATVAISVRKFLSQLLLSIFHRIGSSGNLPHNRRKVLIPDGRTNDPMTRLSVETYDTPQLHLPDGAGVYELAVKVQDHPMIVVYVGSKENPASAQSSRHCDSTPPSSAQ